MEATYNCKITTTIVLQHSMGVVPDHRFSFNSFRASDTHRKLQEERRHKVDAVQAYSSFTLGYSMAKRKVFVSWNKTT